MIIYKLLAVIIVFWIMSIIIRKDLFSPDSIICLSYIFAIICAIYNIDNWGINLHKNTFNLIIYGIFSFLITSLVFYLFQKKRTISSITKKMQYITVKKYKLVILNVISLLILVIYSTYFIKAIGGIGALSNYSKAMELYRSKTMFHHITLIPSWINFLSKFCRAICYIYTYILINNALINKNYTKKIHQKNKFEYIFGIMLYIPLTLMSGGRYDLIVLILYSLVLLTILYTIENKKRLKTGKILKIGLVLMIVLIGFSSYRGLVGRTSESTTLDYITEYFGGSIEILDQYLQEKREKPPYFGQETFAGIRKLMYQIKILDEQGISEDIAEFRMTYSKKVIGNVYTGFRKPYHDFGIPGVTILQSLLAFIFNILYYSCFYKKDKYNISFRIIVTSTLFYCLALHSYSEAFYCNVLSFNYLMFFIIMAITIRFIERVEIKI